MTQIGIPFLFMRGGTSRGPYMNRADLPDDLETLAEVLISIVGSGHPLNIDGIGGGAAVTTKVAMLSVSDDDWADVDYFFGQVSVEDRLVDFKPTCGNILSGVGPAAIEMGLVPAHEGETPVNIRAVNTGAKVAALVQTPGGSVSYEGTAQIDGVPDTAAPVALQFMETVGGVTGAFLPTGKLIDTIDGIEVTCMDVAMPIVMARADSFGLTGYESAAELDENAAFYDRMQAIRIEAGRRMGMGDVSHSVTPKFGLLAPARDGGDHCHALFHAVEVSPHNGRDRRAVPCLLCAHTRYGGRRHGSTAQRDAGENHSGTCLRPDRRDYRLRSRRGRLCHQVSGACAHGPRKLASGSVFVPASVWQGN